MTVSNLDYFKFKKSKKWSEVILILLAVLVIIIRLLIRPTRVQLLIIFVSSRRILPLYYCWPMLRPFLSSFLFILRFFIVITINFNGIVHCCWGVIVDGLFHQLIVILYNHFITINFHHMILMLMCDCLWRCLNDLLHWSWLHKSKRCIFEFWIACYSVQPLAFPVDLSGFQSFNHFLLFLLKLLQLL